MTDQKVVMEATADMTVHRARLHHRQALADTRSQSNGTPLSCITAYPQVVLLLGCGGQPLCNGHGAFILPRDLLGLVYPRFEVLSGFCRFCFYLCNLGR